MKSLLVVAALATAARAEPDDRDRLLHAGAIAALGASYLALDYEITPAITPSDCHWCVPPGFDRDIRNALHWSDTARAAQISTVTAYGLTPLVAGSLVVAGGWCGHTWRTVFDDGAPIAESMLLAMDLAELVKPAVARQRPYARFAPHPTASPEDNASFYSGHTTAAFAVAVSAGMVAHARHYRSEPAIWASCLALAATAGYLRIAADEHYATDVITGAAAGALVGIAWTRIVPTPSGLAVAGTF